MEVTGNVAVFVDADNLLPYWRQDRQSGLRLADYLQRSDFVEVLAELERRTDELGTVIVREAFGKWDNPARRLAAALLYREHGYALQHVPPLSRRGKQDAGEPLKNAGDILLAARAIREVTTGPFEIGTVVIAAADKDYHPLVVELKRLGKRVICLSFPLQGQQKTLLRAVFDDYIELTPVERWERLDREYRGAAPRRAVTAKTPPAPTPAAQLAPATPPRVVEPERDAIAAPTTVAERLWEVLDAGPLSNKLLISRLLVGTGLSQDTAAGLSLRLVQTALVDQDGTQRTRSSTLDREPWLATVADLVITNVASRELRREARTDDPVAAKVERARATTRASFADVDNALDAAIERVLAERTAIDLAPREPAPEAEPAPDPDSAAAGEA